MNDFISRIIEIDRQAREVAVDADALKAHADKEIAKSNAEFKKEIDEKTDKRVEDYRKTAQKASDDRLAAKEKYYAETADGFGLIAQRESDKWVEELVKRALS